MDIGQNGTVPQADTPLPELGRYTRGDLEMLPDEVYNLIKFTNLVQEKCVMSNHSEPTLIRWLTPLLVTVFLAACGQAGPEEVPTRTLSSVEETFRPSETEVPSLITPQDTPGMVVPIPAITLNPSPTPSRTPFPRSLDHYQLVYDPQATAAIPIQQSVGFSIWHGSIPAQPIENAPQFTNYSVPADLTPFGSDLLIQAGCEVSQWYGVQCSPESPLMKFDCTEITYSEKVYFQPQKDLALVGECWRETDDHEATPGDGIFLLGCAFLRKVGYFFQVGSQIKLVTDHDDLRSLFAPIESQSEAISYAQLVTGLDAVYGLSFEPSLLYLQDHLEDTRADLAGDGYRINLYHRPYCSCEPYVYSEIILHVYRDGSIIWETANPFAITTGFSCAD